MEQRNRKSINDKLRKYTYSRNDNDYIEVTEWVNGEGYDISISTENSDKIFSLSDGELDAINYLINTLRFGDTN